MLYSAEVPESACASVTGIFKSVGRRITGFFQSLIGSRAEAVGTSYDYVGNTRDESLYMNFDLGAEESGDYYLLVEVTDVNSGTSAQKTVTIHIE